MGNLTSDQEGGYMLRAPLLTLLLLWPLATQAQTKAACTFKFFSPTTKFKLNNGTPIFMLPLGINDFGTIVGVNTAGIPARGLIRWANGGVTSVKGTHWLTARNDHGTSVGADLANQGILVNGTTITPIVLNVNNSAIDARGINKWGTIVGQYDDNSGRHGFKRWNTGTTHTLDFPGARGTAPHGINDNGTVVGYYFAHDGLVHGFIFHNGQWATLDYPHQFAGGTEMVGITNSGKIFGNDEGPFSTTPFLYENGTFKVISVPNSGSQPYLFSISSKLGLILGVTDVTVVGSTAFIAQCQ